MEVRKLEDVNKRLGLLSGKLRNGAVSAGVFERLTALCQALAGGDARTALMRSLDPGHQTSRG